MHTVPFKCDFQFDLSKYKTGDFSIDFKIAGMDKTTLNPITEPLSLFTIKSGSMKEATVHIEGDNFATKCKLLMLYKDLHITPLKPDDDSSDLKKKPVTSFIANTFFIKNDNPSHGDSPRNSEIVLQRAHEAFFNLVWKTLLTAILKTIGVPQKYADK